MSNILHNESALARLEVKRYCKKSINTTEKVNQFHKQAQTIVFHFSSNRAKLDEIGIVVLSQTTCRSPGVDV